MRLLVGALLLLLGTVSARAESDIELLNATLVAKFHFAQEASDGQMVGAYQVSFRNNGDTVLRTVSLLLNPGLTVDHVVGPGGKKLKATSRLVPVQGFDYLELNQVEVTLARPLLKGMSRREIVVHYRGYLEDLSQTGLVGVKETLHPDFTMIRAQSFGYPVFADTEQLSIQRAWTHKPFYQVAFLDVPGTNTVVGNLDIAQKSTDGDITKFEMKSDYPTSLMALAIAPYSVRNETNFAVASLSSENKYLGRAEGMAKSLGKIIEDALGPASSDGNVKLVSIPGGYQSPAWASTTTLFIPLAEQSPNEPKPSLQKLIENVHEIVERQMQEDRDLQQQVTTAIFSVWKTNPSGNPDHWGAGLDSVLVGGLFGGLDSGSQYLFKKTTKLCEMRPSIGKTALTDFAVDGYVSETAPVSALGFAVLYELLGRDEFFALVRGMRADLSVGYVDMQSVADYLDMHITDKKARRFAENWFTRGRIGKDMAKASTFDELVALYR